MSVLSEISTAGSLWIDAVAGVVKGALQRFAQSRRIELIEEDDGAFTVQSVAEDVTKAELTPTRVQTSRVQIVDGAVVGLDPDWVAAFRDSEARLALRSSRFLFRPLDLPKRAAEFLDGIIRAQIDRLTPWSASDAVYHWTPPQEAGERIAMTVVATARTMVAPLAEAFADLGVAAVEITTVTPTPEASTVTVYRQQARARAEFMRIRTVLAAILLVAGVAAVLSLGVSGFLASSYDDELSQLQRRIAERRAAIRAGQGTAGSAVALLERRKQTSPSVVMVIEALSALLPDHTYATELDIQGDKLQITGFTHDAPALIPLLEQSPNFTRATFYAPTTRGPNDPGERFHIETKIKPYFKPGT